MHYYKQRALLGTFWLPCSSCHSEC